MDHKLHIIYVPGIGDTNPKAQRKVIKTWRWWGVEPEMFQMVWADSRPWHVKFTQLLARIDELADAGKNIALVGASAGGGAVINAYAARQDKISGVVVISGKIFRPDAIGQSYRKNDPSFVESAYDVSKSLEDLNAEARGHILSRYALVDEVVNVKDSHIDGAVNRRSPSIGHLVTIALQITFGAPSFIRFLKRQVKQ